MAAAEITEVIYNVSPNLGGKVMKFKFTGAADNDWVVFDDPIGCVFATLPTGATSATLYAAGASTNDAAGVLTDASTDDTFTYDSVTDAAELPSTLGYIMMETEIMQYTAGGAGTSGTFTGLNRGLFGTTIAAHAQDADFYILNTIVFSIGTTGLVRGIAEIIEE